MQTFHRTPPEGGTPNAERIGGQSRLSQVAGVSLLLLFGCVVGLVFVEIVPRLIPRLLPSGFQGLERVYAGRAKWEKMMIADPFLGYRPRPDLDLSMPSEGRNISVRTTSYGLGEVGFRQIGATPPFDAVALGDSFTFCDDVTSEDCWVRKVGEKTGLSIATLGVSGYSTLAEARLLERYGLRLRPRIVLVAVFANDFNDNVDFDDWLASANDNFWLWRTQAEGRGPTARWLAEHSQSFRLLEAARRGSGRKTLRYKEGDLDLVFRVDRWWLPDSDRQRAQGRERGWRLMRGALDKMKKDAASIGAALVVVLIPAKEEIYWGLVHEHMPKLGDNAALEADHPLEIVRQYCADQRIHACDLRTSLQPIADQGKQLYLRVSGHWNDAGNVVAGEAVAGCLARDGLVNVAKESGQARGGQE